MSIQLQQPIATQLAPPAVVQYRVVSEPDTNAELVQPWPITGAVWASIGGVCTKPGCTLAYRLLSMDLAGNVTSVGPSITLTSGSGAADFGTVWLGTPSIDPTVSVCSDLLALKVDSVSGGTWTLNANAFIPATAQSATTS
jgi:hypothetical protein